MGLHLHRPSLIDGRVPLPKLAAGGQPPGKDLPAARDQQVVVAACRHHGRATIVRPLRARQEPVKAPSRPEALSFMARMYMVCGLLICLMTCPTMATAIVIPDQQLDLFHGTTLAPQLL